MSGRALVFWVGLLLAATLTRALPAPAAAREFRLADTHPESYPTVQAALHMARLIAERSLGRHSVRVFASHQLGEENETIEQTRLGAIDLDRINVTPFNNLVPETQILSLPFVFRSPSHLRHVIDGPIGEEVLAAFEKHGFIGLAYYDSGARSFYNAKRPIRELGDMRGLRVRVQKSDLWLAMVEALGATAVPLPFGQVNTALAAGLIDGAENNWPSYEQNEHYRAAPYYSLTEHAMAPEVLVMSKKAWDGLSPADQALFRQAARDSSTYMRDLWRHAETRSEEVARGAGVAVNGAIDKAPFRAAMAPVYERFIVDPALKDLMRRIEAVE